MTLRTFTTGIKRWRKENAEIEARQLVSTSDVEEAKAGTTPVDNPTPLEGLNKNVTNTIIFGYRFWYVFDQNLFQNRKNCSKIVNFCLNLPKLFQTFKFRFRDKNATQYEQLDEGPDKPCVSSFYMDIGLLLCMLAVVVGCGVARNRVAGGENAGFSVLEKPLGVILMLVPCLSCILLTYYFRVQMIVASRRRARANIASRKPNVNRNSSEYNAYESGIATAESAEFRLDDHDTAIRAAINPFRKFIDEEIPAFTYPFMSFMAGIASGLFGIGGGLIFSPFLLYQGVAPTKATVTSATCVIFTASSTTMQYLFMGRVLVDYAVIFGIVSTFASIGGAKLKNNLANKSFEYLARCEGKFCFRTLQN